MNAGTSIKAITDTIIGISTTRAAFIPPISLSAGTANGFIVIAIPLTRTRLNKFAPRIFPREREACPLIRDDIAVTSSGREVTRAMNVRAITYRCAYNKEDDIFPHWILVDFLFYILFFVAVDF